ncbi:MAG: hypothetical protein H7Y02_07410 [Candidatus Obscuribacterales bacterium]|nr:hypothetical protein [Steroidobacteraceae bacterium]
MNHVTGYARRIVHIYPLLLLLLCINSTHAAGAKWKIPKTEHAQPDLQGLWDTGTQTPFQRPASLGEQRAYSEQEAAEFENKAREANKKMDAPVDLSKGAPTVGGYVGQEADQGSIVRRHDLTRVNGEYRTSVIIDPPNGQMPTRKGFVDFFGQRTARGIGAHDGPDTMDASARCLTPLPVPTIYPMPWNAFLQIVQAKDHIVLFTEAPQEARIVRLNSVHRDRSMRFWMGDSIGYWEGNTLVVHTANFRPEQSFSFMMAMPEDLELTERFTRTSKDEIVYSFTIVDLKAFTSPFTGERTIKRADPRDRILEYACHEGNYSMQGILAGTRKHERDAAQKSKPESP